MKPVLDAIRVRRSHRSYVPDAELEDWQVDNIIKAAMWAPSGRHAEVCNIILVRDRETKTALSRATPYAYMIEKASLAAVIVADDSLSDLWIEDCSAAAENILIESADMDLGTCWVQVHHLEKDVNYEDKVRKLVDIPDNFRVLCMISVGVPAKEKEPHTDEEINRDRIHFEKF